MATYAGGISLFQGAEEKIVAVSFCSFVVGETTSGMVDKDEDRKCRECIARWRKKCGIGGFCRLLLWCFLSFVGFVC